MAFIKQIAQFMSVDISMVKRQGMRAEDTDQAGPSFLFAIPAYAHVEFCQPSGILVAAC